MWEDVPILEYADRMTLLSSLPRTLAHYLAEQMESERACIQDRSLDWFVWTA